LWLSLFFLVNSCSASLRPNQGKKTNRHKEFGGCSIARHQPQKERLTADFFDLFRSAPRLRLPLHAHSPAFCVSCLASFNSRSVVAVNDRNTATRSQKKAFYELGWVTLFFALLGC
jgi:hypothetical protein